MTSGGDHQQWGYSHFNQSGQATGQTGNFMNQGFAGDGDNDINTNAFAIPQQWEPQDNQFLHDNNFSSFQPQSSGYPVQHFSGNNSHVQGHQHPQSYSAPISMEGPSDMNWDYDFGFDENALTGMADGGIPYTNSLQQGSNANGLTSSSSFPQDMSNAMPAQQQFATDPSSGNLYASSQTSAYGRNTQQSPPQAMAQPISQRQVIDYQQPQSAVTQHHQSAGHQHQHPALPQNLQSNLLQAGSQQPNHLQSINHLQQTSRIGTPQSGTPTAQPRQSPFNGRNVPPLSMQQQGPLSTPDAQGSPAMPFSAPQQTNAQTNVLKASPGLSNAQTTQSRFVPQQIVPAQRPSHSPIPPASNTALPNVMPKAQQQNMQPNFQTSVQSHIQPNSQPKTNMPIASAAPPAQPIVRGLAPPRVLRYDNHNSTMGSRFIGFTAATALPVSGNPIDEIPDPSQVTGDSFGRFLPPGPGGQIRILAFEALRHWTKAVEQDDVAGQNEWEQRLRNFLGESRLFSPDSLQANLSVLFKTLQVALYHTITKSSSRKHGPPRRRPLADEDL